MNIVEIPKVVGETAKLSAGDICPKCKQLFKLGIENTETGEQMCYGCHIQQEIDKQTAFERLTKD